MAIQFIYSSLKQVIQRSLARVGSFLSFLHSSNGFQRHSIRNKTKNIIPLYAI
jgi:hypothetical protein